MKKLFVAGTIATILAASMVFAIELPTTQPIKGTEGPDVRLAQSHRAMQPITGIEGPDVR